MTATPIQLVPSEIADQKLVNTINALVQAVNALNGVSTPAQPED